MKGKNYLSFFMLGPEGKRYEIRGQISSNNAPLRMNFDLDYLSSRENQKFENIFESPLEFFTIFNTNLGVWV